MPQRQADKIIIDASSEDEAKIAELLSRLEPGEKITGTFTATLDEFQDKIGVLSIDEIEVKSEDLGEAGDGESEKGDEPTTATPAAAVTLFKKGKKDGSEAEEPADE